MKKIFLLIPLLMITFGCVESELYIQGENVGDINDDTPDTPTTILQKYEFTSTADNSAMNFASSGELTSLNVNGESINLTYTEGILTSATAAGQNLNIAYNDQGKINLISLASDPNTNLEITYDTAGATGLRTMASTAENTYNFTLDASGYITSYTMTNAANNDEIAMNLNFTGANVTQVIYTENNAEIAAYNFTFDNQINPIFTQAINEFNALIFMQAFALQNASNTVLTEFLARIRSQNNITGITATGSNPFGGTFEYTYNADNYPESAVFTQSGSDLTGSSTFTYY